MYPDTGSFNWSGLLAGIGGSVGGIISGLEGNPNPIGVNVRPVGYSPYNYGAGSYVYNPYTGQYNVQPTMLDTYNNTGLFSGTSGAVLVIGLLVAAVLIFK